MEEKIRVPEGWKVEIRVRKTGRKDRYYVDPVNGYIFRSLKDIDRYLLTGNLGRHVTKSKPKVSGCNYNKLDVNPLSDVSNEKPDGIRKKVEEPEPDGKKIDQEEKLDGKASDREDFGALDCLERPNKKRSTSFSRKTSRSSREKATTPFFILDPDKCEEGNTVDIPNLSEIIDSVQREKEGHNAIYLSAATIGTLLGAQLSDGWSDPDISEMSPFARTLYEDCLKPNFPGIVPKFNVKGNGWMLQNIISPYQNPPLQEKLSQTFDTKNTEKEDSISPVFGDLLTDPCIDFAIKTLTGTMPLGTEPDLKNCSLQQEGGSSTITKEDSPCQTDV